jgi:hypothetical protein
VASEQSVRIDDDLWAWKDPDREAWEIRASDDVVGWVVATASGFQALALVNDDYVSVGTFISMETAARALRPEGGSV